MEHTLLVGDVLDCLSTLPDESVNCVVTSPPYFGLRDYGVKGQIGLEATPEEYVDRLVEVFREVRRVLRKDGTCWINLGDCYAGSSMNGGDGSTSTLRGTHHRQRTDSSKWREYKRGLSNGLKPKDLVGIPWRVAFALQADGWWLRSDIIWSKVNSLPESVTDRPTKAHEYVFLLTKSPRYYYDAEAIREPASEATVKRYKSGYNRAFERARLADPRDNRFSGSSYGQGILDASRGRNKRTVWNIATQPFKGAHFATFPEKLVEPCILAGTSEHGCCPKCGAPWERVVERIAGVAKECPKTQAAHEARGGTGKPSGTVGKSGGGRIDSISRTIGWRPTCSCEGNDGSGGPIVLDPFGGAGTVSLVAERLGRNSIYIDLSDAYADMARGRICSKGSQPTFTIKHIAPKVSSLVSEG